MTDTEVLEYMPAKFNVLIIYKKQVRQQDTNPPYGGGQLKLCGTLSPLITGWQQRRWCIKITIVDEYLVHHCWK